MIFILLGVTLVVVSAQLSRIKAAQFQSGERSGAFFDEADRERLFHGVNVIRKEPPWHPVDVGWLPDNASLDLLAASGVNVVRLGWMW
jgi:hypothetical protein